MDSYHVVGVMSGTSLDGLDLVFSSFIHNTGGWTYRIEAAETITYDKEMSDFLSGTFFCSGADLIERHAAYGTFIGREINRFLQKNKLKADLISSHGHTIFHQPGKRFTFQLGSGAHIASVTGITTVSDFRSFDVAYGGQGAPLVPAGDELLFGKYDFCLNLGGFSNISFNLDGKRIAFDICPVNIFINTWMNKAGKNFDDRGMTASAGTINEELLNVLNGIAFYRMKYPKSLGREWFEAEFMKVIERFNDKFENVLRTAYEHFAVQIANALCIKPEGKVLVTGGGTFNDLLISLIAKKTKITIEIPDVKLIHFKEALIFAFLGVLRFRKEVNCFASVTGAAGDSSTGIVHLIPVNNIL